MQNLLEMDVKSHKAWLKSEFYHICLSVCLCAIDVWSRSSFRVTQCWLPQCWCLQNNWSCTEISPFTDCNKTHFCCKFVIHSLDMKPFYWFQWYKWLKMDCKMSLVLLTTSFDITEDFHILHSAYKVTYTFVIPSLKQKLTTGSLTHTHNHQQLQTKSNWACHISC